MTDDYNGSPVHIELEPSVGPLLKKIQSLENEKELLTKLINDIMIYVIDAHEYLGNGDVWGTHEKLELAEYEYDLHFHFKGSE
jgi:hypothetical protein